MQVAVFKRSGTAKKALGDIRRSGDVPAVLYSKTGAPESITVKGTDFQSMLRSITPGQLSTTRIQLDMEGKKRKVLVKDIQYHFTTYQVQHLDFIELFDDVPVDVNVPIHCVGAADCVGVKLGGFLRQVIRTTRVRCLPKDIPAFFQVDVKDLAVNQTKKLADLSLPQGVRPLDKIDQVLVVVAKR